MATIFLDESGYTGEDILNENQPFFVLATLDLDEASCQEIKQRFFGRVQAKELKHSSLSKYSKQQGMVIDFLSYLKDNQEFIKIGIVDKKYSLVCRMIDYIIEPVMYDDDIDLYDRGGNIGLANLFFYTMPVFGSPEFFLSLLTRFQEMIRTRSEESYQLFFDLVFQEYEKDELNEQLNYLRIADYAYGFNMLNDIPENALDIALSLSLTLMAMWREKISDPITLIHDISSNMSRQKHIWNALMNPDLLPKTVGYDRRKMKLPIAVSETKFERSEDWAGLQLVDVIAGATVRAAKLLSGDQNASTSSYDRELARIIDEIPIFPVLPSTKVTPQELGTIGENSENPINYFGGIMHKVKNIPRED